MKTLITEFISLDGVVQAPGGPTEDTDGGFKHGGWSMKYFDPVVMGGTFAEIAATAFIDTQTEALAISEKDKPKTRKKVLKKTIEAIADLGGTLPEASKKRQKGKP